MVRDSIDSSPGTATLQERAAIFFKALQGKQVSNVLGLRKETEAPGSAGFMVGGEKTAGIPDQAAVITVVASRRSSLC